MNETLFDETAFPASPLEVCMELLDESRGELLSACTSYVGCPSKANSTVPYEHLAKATVAMHGATLELGQSSSQDDCIQSVKTILMNDKAQREAHINGLPGGKRIAPLAAADKTVTDLLRGFYADSLGDIEKFAQYSAAFFEQLGKRDLNTFVENTHVYYARRAAVEMSTAADKSAAAEQPARVIDTGIVYPVVEGTPHLGTRLGKLAMNFLGDQVRKRSGFIFRSIY